MTDLISLLVATVCLVLAMYSKNSTWARIACTFAAVLNVYLAAAL